MMSCPNLSVYFPLNIHSPTLGPLLSPSNRWASVSSTSLIHPASMEGPDGKAQGTASPLTRASAYGLPSTSGPSGSLQDTSVAIIRAGVTASKRIDISWSLRRDLIRNRKGLLKPIDRLNHQEREDRSRDADHVREQLEVRGGNEGRQCMGFLPDGGCEAHRAPPHEVRGPPRTHKGRAGKPADGVTPILDFAAPIELGGDLIPPEQIDDRDEPVPDRPAGREFRLARSDEPQVGVRTVLPHPPAEGRGEKQHEAEDRDELFAGVVGARLLRGQLGAVLDTDEHRVLRQRRSDGDQFEQEKGDEESAEDSGAAVRELGARLKGFSHGVTIRYGRRVGEGPAPQKS